MEANTDGLHTNRYSQGTWVQVGFKSSWIGLGWLRCYLVMWLRVRFIRNHIYQCLVTKKIIFLCRTHQFSLPCYRFGEAAFRWFSWWFPIKSGVMLHCRTVHVNSFFKKQTNTVNWFYLHYSREREQQFFKKNIV